MADYTTLQSLLASIGTPSMPMEAPATVSAAVGAAPEQPRKHRFMLVGTHAQQTTGYSKVTYNIVQQLSKYEDIEVFHFGFQRFFEIAPNYRPYPPNVDVYDPAKHEHTDPSVPKEEGFGYSQLPAYVEKVRPDVILIYNDAMVITKFLEKLAAKYPNKEDRFYKLIIYFDQVYIAQRPDLVGRIDQDADVYFAFTTYWRECLRSQGIRKPIYILRHGFDADTYVPKDRAAMRAKHNIPENLFLMLNINRNTPRKRYDILMAALAELVARYPTKPIALLCVCDGGEMGGFPIFEIYRKELIKRNVSPDQHINKLLITKSALNYTDETVNELYSMSDIGVTAAEGEGFGLCQFEAMGCGVPQVVPDVGGFKDFCNKANSVMVRPERSYYIPYSYSPLGGIAELVSPADYCLGIEEYLLDSDLREKHGAAARQTILGYRWEDEVAELARVIRNI
jgi:glycosyltransferase involved in cell wall biosynthesis